MRLIAEYSWPLRDKIVSSLYSYPFVNQKKLLEATNEFLEDAMKRVSTPGFAMSMRVEND